MKPRDALWLALRDFYANSWRLVPVNAALGAVLVVAAFAALVTPVAARPRRPRRPGRGCAPPLRSDARADRESRAHRRLGRAAPPLAAAGSGSGRRAPRSWHSACSRSASTAARRLWPLAFLTLYLLVVLGIYQLILWTLAIAEPEPADSRARHATQESRSQRDQAPRSLSGSLCCSSTSPGWPRRSCRS